MLLAERLGYVAYIIEPKEISKRWSTPDTSAVDDETLKQPFGSLWRCRASFHLAKDASSLRAIASSGLRGAKKSCWHPFGHLAM